jgi:hypothetical protein
MKDRPKDSSASKTTEVPAVFLVVYFDCDGDAILHATFNTFADALDFASGHMDDLKKNGDPGEYRVASKDALCAIYQRVCRTEGTTTQTVHLIS